MFTGTENTQTVASGCNSFENASYKLVYIFLFIKYCLREALQLNLIFLLDNNPLHYMTREEHEQFRHNFPKVAFIILGVAAALIFGKAIITGLVRGYVIKHELKDARNDPHQQAIAQVVRQDNECCAKERDEAIERRRQAEFGGADDPDSPPAT